MLHSWSILDIWYCTQASKPSLSTGSALQHTVIFVYIKSTKAPCFLLICFAGTWKCMRIRASHCFNLQSDFDIKSSKECCDIHSLPIWDGGCFECCTLLCLCCGYRYCVCVSQRWWRAKLTACSAWVTAANRAPMTCTLRDLTPPVTRVCTPHYSSHPPHQQQTYVLTEIATTLRVC